MSILTGRVTYGPRHEKTCLWGFVNNKDADQTAHLRSLISAFVIPFLENFVSRLGEILIFWLVYIAEQAVLNLTLQETPKTGFVATQPISGQDYMCRMQK